jgi:RNA polymerase sigma factor (sigma-70 family)
MLVGSRSDAEDLAQETLIVMHRHWARLREPDAAESYALKTLVRLARKHLRRLHLRRETPLPGRSEVDEPVATTVEIGPDLMVALAALPVRQRETIVLRYFLDLSIADTAVVMRCSAGTVKSQTSDALTAIRMHLATPAQQPVLGKDSHGD